MMIMSIKNNDHYYDLLMYVCDCAGQHIVSVRYADIDISGSPFYVQVLDPTQIWVSSIPQTSVRDQPVKFDG